MVKKGLNEFTANEFLKLIQEVGWDSHDKISLQGLKLALASSTQIYCIRSDEGQLLALGRVLSDNYIFSTIPEILVVPTHQKIGLGSLIMEEIIKDFGHTVLYFGAQSGNESFIEKFGFQKGCQSYTRHFLGFKKI